MEYSEFLEGKAKKFIPCGFDPEEINPTLFDFQQAIARWSIRKGRAAIWADCGLGKTGLQLEWGKHVSRYTNLPVLLFAPLAVCEQTAEQGRDVFDVPVTICESQRDIRVGVNITNYEKLAKFSSVGLGGIALDESSILKGMDGTTRKALTSFASTLPYRLACTATPAPNDYMELGTHAEFLGIMTVPEMLATFFVHDGGDTSKWRLKKHATKDFWKWLCSWAVAIRKPSDIGFSDEGFVLPELRLHQVTVESKVPEGCLFATEASTLDERRAARKDSIEDRVDACAEIVNASPEQFMVWCNLNAESEALTKAIDGAIEVTGSDSDRHKKESAHKFSHSQIQRMVSKSLIFGLGMNFQVCHKFACVGLSDSWEQFYQLVRRHWRFGQKHVVDGYIITSEAEGAVVKNIQRKEEQARVLMEGMIEAMKDEMNKELRGHQKPKQTLTRKIEAGDGWSVALNDCIDETAIMQPQSMDYSIFSPPFASLYTYSASDRDMGNCTSHAEFYEHLRFLAANLYRILKDGRLLSFHCMNLPRSKERDGVIGVWDFRGALIRLFEDAGFIFHSEVCIWKDPVTAMQRTKAIGLLYRQLRKDSHLSRQGIPDYLVTMRKPGTNTDPITKTHESFPVSLWQRYASPVWMDINPGDTLQKESAREHEDERHICPLQLEVIRRGIQLWTNPGDVVLDPFTGIGSTGYVAIQEGRRFQGVELKESYWKQAVANLKNAGKIQGGLFSDLMGVSMRDCDEAAEAHINGLPCPITMEGLSE